MASTTFEAAKRCPKCDTPGEEVSRSPAKGGRPGTMVALVYCRNGQEDANGVVSGSCRWFNTAWPIQINPDGTVPIIDHTKTEKEYPGLLPDEQQERYLASVQRQLDMEQKPGAEVRNPHSER